MGVGRRGRACPARRRGRLGLGPDAILCTHIVRAGTPHYAGTLTLPAHDEVLARATGSEAIAGAGVALLASGTGPWTSGPEQLAQSALAVAGERVECRDGRAVQFPGAGLLTGRVPVSDVLAGTAIEQVAVLGGTLPPAAVLETRDFVRPQWRDGRLVLLALPGGEGAGGENLVAPFEVPNPTPCCGGH